MRVVTYLLIHSLKEKKEKLLCSWWTKATFEMPLSAFLFGTSVSNFLPSSVNTKAPRVMQKKTGCPCHSNPTQKNKKNIALSVIWFGRLTAQNFRTFFPAKPFKKLSSRHILPEDHLQETSKFVAVCPSHRLVPRRREGVRDGWSMAPKKSGIR